MSHDEVNRGDVKIVFELLAIQCSEYIDFDIWVG
jgi:hypothetical protein